MSASIWTPTQSVVVGGAGASIALDAKTDFSCVGDGVTDDTFNLQRAITAAETEGKSLFLPSGTYRVTATLTATKRLHMFGTGARTSTIRSSASEAFLVLTPLNYGNTFSYYHDFGIVPEVAGGGVNGFVCRLTAAGAGFSYMSDFMIERTYIGDFSGYGLVFDNGVSNTQGFSTFSVRRNWISNGINGIKLGDSVNFEENTITDGETIVANKTGGRIGFLLTSMPGTQQVIIRSNNITTSAGSLALINMDQVTVENNQCEHPYTKDIPYGASGIYGSLLYINNVSHSTINGNTIQPGNLDSIVRTGTLAGTPVITGLSSTADLSVGMSVSGSNIVLGSRIQSINSATQITLTVGATGSGATSLTFGYAPNVAVLFEGTNCAYNTFTNNHVYKGTLTHLNFTSGVGIPVVTLGEGNVYEDTGASPAIPLVSNPYGNINASLLPAVTSSSLPDATDFPGGVIWDTTVLKAKISNGAVWSDLGSGSGGAGVATRLKADLGAIGDGVADDTAALVAAIAAMPEGSTLVLDGLFRITSTVSWNKRVSPFCFAATYGILVECGPLNDGIIFRGTEPVLVNGLNGMDIRLNVYGRANACAHAVTFERLDRSRVLLNVRAGATAYAVRLRGCLINEWQIDSSVNYPPPISSPGMCLHHMLVENFGVPTGISNSVTIPSSPATTFTRTAHGYTALTRLVFTGTPPPTPFILGKPYFVRAAGLTANTFTLSATDGGPAVTTSSAGGTFTVATCEPVASNTNTFWVNFEGGTDGYVQPAMPGEGSNTLTGEIEGLVGVPIYVEACLGLTVMNLKMEANSLGCQFNSCESLYLGPAIVNFGSASNGLFTLNSCQQYTVDGYFGKLTVNQNCFGGKIGQIECPGIGDVQILDRTVNQSAPVTITANRNLGIGPGTIGGDCIFVNPFTEMYGANNPTVGPPLGFTSYGSGGGGVKALTPVYPGNPFITSINASTNNTGTHTNGLSVTNSAFSPTALEEWYSVFIPTYAVSNRALPSLRVLINGSDLYTLSLTPATSGLNTWMENRASFKVPAGQTWVVFISLIDNNTGTYQLSSGWQYYIGGCVIYRGAIPPRFLHNSLSRQAHVSPSVSHPPPYLGCKAYVAGKWYLAADTSTAADWIILN